MLYENRWEIIAEIGGGGQGKVFRVLDKLNFDGISLEFVRNITKSITVLRNNELEYDQKQHFEEFRKALRVLINMEDFLNHGALKVLHDPREARDPGRAHERIKREIDVMSKILHPNLLKILDHDDEGKWFVSQFHPKGDLFDNKSKFTGNLAKALRAFRPIVEGVAILHREGIVHRDIKLQNIFLDSNNNLILGDFGLVFFNDDKHTRISETFENVGSRDWMPAWAQSIRIEEISPAFDVFSLGKLLWAMVSKNPILPLWYFDRPENNLEQMFPKDQTMKFANELFKNCIVEHESDCLPDAEALLNEVDQTIYKVGISADSIGDDDDRPCKICGIGKYEIFADVDDHSGITNFGLNLVGQRKFKIFTCNYCGNVQIFTFNNENSLLAWFR